MAVEPECAGGGRQYPGSIIANGYIYVIGGHDGTNPVSTVYYAKLNADGSTGAFAATTAITAARYGHTSVTANGYIYVLGGYNSGVQSTVYYAKLNANGTVGSWNTTTALSAARYTHSSVVANGYVYVIGGNDGSVQTNVWYAKLNADGTLGNWNSTTALTEGRFAHSSVVANGYLYVIGGNNGTSDQSTVYYAKIQADGTILGGWYAGGALTVAKAYLSLVVVNGYVYAIGGSAQPYTYYAKLNANGSVGAWTGAANNLPDVRSMHSSVTANGYVYVLGGYDGSNVESTVYYASTSRITLGGSLDLVGLGGQNLAEGGDFSQGSTGGTLTAGNTTIVGSLQVVGQANFGQGVSVLGNFTNFGSALFKNSADSTTAFQVQNSAGTTTLINADTTNLLVTIGTDLKIAKRADSGGTTADWSKVSYGTGTIDSGGTGSIDITYSMTVYNGSLYVGTAKANGAEIYR